VTRWTQQPIIEYKNKRRGEASGVSTPATALDRLKALGRLKPGEMNKTEQRYDAFLQNETHAGRILWHKFGAIKLRLADNTFLTVDFAVLPAGDRVLEMVDVKGGFTFDDARVKIKVAASLYPFRFVIVKPRAQKAGGGWEREEF
jgi:hypothetical protein